MLKQLPIILQAFLFFRCANTYLISSPVASDKVQSCGSSPAEAQELGCRFDIWSYQWDVPACYNPTLNQEFTIQHREEIEWRHMDYTPIITEQVLKGEHTYLRPITGHFHDLHCTYEWLRLIRALAEERPLDQKTLETMHSHHCSTSLLEKDKRGRNETATQVAEMGFSSCGVPADLMYKYGAKDGTARPHRPEVADQ